MRFETGPEQGVIVSVQNGPTGASALLTLEETMGLIDGLTKSLAEAHRAQNDWRARPPRERIESVDDHNWHLTGSPTETETLYAMEYLDEMTSPNLEDGLTIIDPANETPEP